MRKWLFDRRSFLSLAVAALFTLSIGSVSWAKTEEELNAEQQVINQQIEAKNKQLIEIKQATDTEAAKLGEIESRLAEATGVYNKLNNQIKELEAKITGTDKEIAVTEKNLAERRAILGQRMKDIYKRGQISYLDVLLGATDFVDFATRLQVLQKVLSNDVNLITDVLEKQGTLNQLKTDLTQQKEKLATVRKEAEDKKISIETERKAQKEIYDRIFANKELAEKEKKELEDTSKQIERALKGKRSGFAGATSQFIMPADGPVTSHFSLSRVHPVFGNVRPHNGTDIGASYGSEIYASDGGRVIFVGWQSGYGNTIMLDHGNGYVTLYAHQSGFNVSYGQDVAQGQVIGFVGSTGYSTGPHLHFEIRYDGELRDPHDFVPGL